MKKVLFTEAQIKKVIDALITEQTDYQILIATVRCFLNQVAGAKLDVGGNTNDNGKTQAALKAFQEKKVKMGHKIIPDGQWGYNTQSTLTPQEAQIWKKCVRKYQMA